MIFIIDFDGTIAPADTVDSLLVRFADPAWEAIEEDWVHGRINSKTCMQKQLNLISSDRKPLEEFFDAVDIDPSFGGFVRSVCALADVAVVSDGLDYPIERTLQRIGMSSIPVFANKLIFEPNGLDISFPHSADACAPQSGVCKCAVARAFDKGPVILVGDGRSDYCLARSADFVFAKGSLKSFCETENIPHTPFVSFNDILTVVRQWTVPERRYAT